MKWLLIFLMVFGGGISSVQASPWPYYSFDITYCTTKDCTTGARYGNVRTFWLDIPSTSSSVYLTTKLASVGVHCDSGNPTVGFSSCIFQDSRALGSSHAPELLNPNQCNTTEDNNWILVSPDACAANPNFSGYHSGASPGAECAVLGKVPSYANVYSVIDTPYGLLTAEQVANSRDTYCVKAIAPALTCNINIPNAGILDHGTQAPNSTSERTLDVEIDCGDSPVITIPDDTVQMDNGRIQSKLSLTPNGPRYLLKSVLTAINATAGSHMGSSVIVVSPL